MVIIDHKKKRGLCVAYRCQNEHSKRDRFCHKHRKRYQKENNPVVYVFGFLKQNAKRRGKGFSLTLEQFRRFCEDTGYLDNRGKTKRSATIDRIDSSRGYSIDNIQVLSLIQNARKGVGDCPF